MTIQSVLDVKDDNPPPKGSHSVFNRSILILTPQRALKFTANNADRHYVWLTALSFLAHSQQDVPEIPTVVPSRAPDVELPALSPSEHSRARKPRIRDSIRLAKGQRSMLNATNALRPAGGIANTMSSQGMVPGTATTGSDIAMSPMPSIPDVPIRIIAGGYRSPSAAAAAASDTAGSSFSQPSNPNSTASQPIHSPRHQADLSRDAAEPPAIPRFGRERGGEAGAGIGAGAAGAPANFHGRKRSNTGGRVPPPLSFRGFAASPTQSGSTHTGYSDPYGNNGPKMADLSGWSERMSEASYRDSINSNAQGNLFEAIGTVRMEAFISPLAYSRYESEGQLNYPDPLDEGRVRARKRTKEIRRRKSRSRSRSRTRESFSKGGVAAWREEYAGLRGRDGYKTAGEEDWARGRRDPFEGF